MNDYTSTPLSRKRIQTIAHWFRQQLGIDEDKFIDVAMILDQLTLCCKHFIYEIVDDDLLPSNIYALTTFDGDRIITQIKESVYDKACNGSGRDRFTLAHELGHVVITGILKTPLKMARSKTPLPRYMDAEWQADCFAGELLAPSDTLEDVSPEEISKEYGITKTAAKYQLICKKNKSQYFA